MSLASSSNMISKGAHSLKNKKRTTLGVYDFNINLMKLQWRGWINHILENELPRPDLILLQDIENDTERKELQGALTDAFGGRWAGRGSEPIWRASIVWRADRFERPKHRAWKGWGHPLSEPGCIESGEGAPAIQVRLFDKEAGKWISAASFKTPGKAGEECVPKNMSLVDSKLKEKGWSGSVLFMGTDANFPDYGEDRTWRSWYRDTISLLKGESNLGYRDPIFELCEGDIDALQEGHRSLGRRRVDYLLFKKVRGRDPRILAADTMPYGGRGAKRWSDHRSVFVQIDY